MNSLLQKHGCANVFTIPEGLKELMSDITREVLRDQPSNMLDYIANYLWALLITREHGLLAVKILEELCDCKPTLEERLGALGMPEDRIRECAMIIQGRFDDFEPASGDKLKEKAIVKKLLGVVELDTEQAASVCHIIQDVYRDYWQRRLSLQEVCSCVTNLMHLMEKLNKLNLKLLSKTIATTADEPWKVAAQRTIDIYKTTRPTFDGLVRATEKIQAAYRGYHVRRQMIQHLEAKPAAREESNTTTLDVAGSREIDLGPTMNVLMEGDEKASPAGDAQSPPHDMAKSMTGRPPKTVSVGSGIDKDTRSRASSSVQFSLQPSDRSSKSSEETLKADSVDKSRGSERRVDLQEPKESRSTYQDDFEEYDGSRSEADGASVSASSVASSEATSAAVDSAAEEDVAEELAEAAAEAEAGAGAEAEAEARAKEAAEAAVSGAESVDTEGEGGGAETETEAEEAD